MKKIRLQEVSYGKREIKEALESLNSTQLTMGKKCRLFELEWNKWQKSKYSTFVNSGSSANLIIISLLRSKRGNYKLKQDDEILVPSVTWSTTLFPIIQLGLKPVLVDVNPKTFNVSVESCEHALTQNTKAVFVVHLLGNPCNMDKIIDFCQSNNLLIIEDCCEAPGAKWNEEKVGNFGIASSFSYMFAHHMTTIEGGMVCCKTELDNKIINANRAHGWIREFTEKQKQEILDELQPDDDRFLFWDLGYNFRPTEINASFGLHQLKKLDEFINIRNSNFNTYQERLKSISDKIQIQELEDPKKSLRSNFAFGIVIKDKRYSRKALFHHLDKNGIESRPLVGGSLKEHAFYKLYFQTNDHISLEVSENIHKNGFYLPNHQGMDERDVEYICNKLLEFFDG